MSDLISNEQTKLLAGALDRAPTACLTVGVIAPVAAVLYNVSGTPADTWVFVVGTIAWLLRPSHYI